MKIGELGNQASNTLNKREREPESQTSVPQALARPKLQPSSSQASTGSNQLFIVLISHSNTALKTRVNSTCTP